MVMAHIYTECGMYDEALDELETVLALETYYNPNELQFNNWIDPLRELPRYKELMKQYAM